MTYPEDIMEAAREAHARFASVMATYNLGEIVAAALLAERKRCAIVVLNAPTRFAGQTEEHVRRKLADAIMGDRDFAVAPDWRPIETAPKDGTVVLVAHDKACFTAWWEVDGFQTSNGAPAWVDGCTNRFDEYTTYEPTHWMPMPALPKNGASHD